MTARRFRLLPEGSRVADHVEEPQFTVVTGDGEIYTLFRIVRITHIAEDRNSPWTHLANVARISDDSIGVAHLRIIDRLVEDSSVVMSSPRS